MKRPLLLLATVGGFLHAAVGTHADPPVLGEPVLVPSNYLNFTLTGDANATYVLERSTNLQGWTAINTNAASNPARTIAIEPGGDHSFFRARRLPMPLFRTALLARGQIDLNGNSLGIDSFDSSDPNYSNGGRYDATRNKDNGDVATNAGLTNSANIGNAKILGRVWTGPGGSVHIGANGSVGDKAWHAGGNHGVKPGWVKNNMNALFPIVEPPFTGGGFTPGSGTVDGVAYDYVLGSLNYQMSSLNMSSPQRMIVTGNAVLYVTGNVSLSGSASIIIATNASLRLYVGGASASLGANGVINQTGYALNFSYFGLVNNTYFSANGSFIGTVYAPNADVSIGSLSADIMGACVARSIEMNGHIQWHFDEQLLRVGPAF